MSVVFDPSALRARYPEFSAASDAALTACFDEAGLYLSNSVSNLTRRALYLNMLTAHIAALGGLSATARDSGTVGRVAAAGEGSVNATLEFLAPGTPAWFMQTQYGASFWQATRSLRSFFYVSP